MYLFVFKHVFSDSGFDEMKFTKKTLPISDGAGFVIAPVSSAPIVKSSWVDTPEICVYELPSIVEVKSKCCLQCISGEGRQPLLHAQTCTKHSKGEPSTIPDT